MTINYKQNNFGDVTLENETVAHLTQQAYLAGTNEAPRYQAKAIDDNGNEYIVTWIPYDNFMEFDDESDCCDWATYVVCAI